MSTNHLSSKPFDVAAVAGRLGAHVIDARAVAPGVVKVTVAPGHVRAALAALIQAGYEAAGSGDHGVLVTLPEPEPLTPAGLLAAATGHPSGRAIRARYTADS